MTALSLAMIILAYLGGSISSAVLVCRGYGLPDPRENGSHNPGATNVLRLGGRSAAILVFVCDMSKGTVPVYLAWYLGVTPFFLGLIGVAACLGHMDPLFFHFQGGKGGAAAPVGGRPATQRLFVVGGSRRRPAGTALHLLAQTRVHHAGRHAVRPGGLPPSGKHHPPAQWPGRQDLAAQKQTPPLKGRRSSAA